MMIRNSLFATLVVSALFFVAGCVDDSTEASGNGGVRAPPAVVTPSQRVHPKLTLSGAVGGTFVGDAGFEVAGDLVKGSGVLTGLTVGEEAVSFSSDGGFVHTVIPLPGINIVEMRVDADDKGRAVEVVSVMGGPVHPPGAKLEKAMLINLGQEMLDDDDDDVDDIARVLEILLVDPGFQAWLATLEFGEEGGISVNKFEAARSDVDIEASSGCLDTTVRIGDASVQGDPGFTIGLGVTGLFAVLGEEITITGKQVTISASLCPEFDVDGNLTTVVETPEVTIVDIAFSTDLYPNMADALPSTHTAIKELAQSLMADALGSALGGMLDQVLGSFEFDLPIWEDPPISAKFVLEDVKIREGVVTLELSHTPTVSMGLPAPVIGAGSYATFDQPPAIRLSTKPLAIAISDDLANQMLFSFWWAGAISNLGFAELLVGADTSKLPKVFQPLTGVEFDIGLPPTLMAAAERDFPFDMAIGELLLTLNRGAPKEFVVSLHIRAGVDLMGEEDGTIKLRLDNRARKITVAAAVRTHPEALDPGDVAALMRMLVPALLGQTNAILPGLTIPNINLSNLPVLSEVDEFAGKVLALTMPDVKRVGDGGAYLVFEGGVILKDAPPSAPKTN